MEILWNLSHGSFMGLANIPWNTHGGFPCKKYMGIPHNVGHWDRRAPSKGDARSFFTARVMSVFFTAHRQKSPSYVSVSTSALNNT